MAKVACLALAGAAALSGCDSLIGFGGPPTPLARVRVEVTGAQPAPARLRVAVVWGAQWLPELFCVLPPETPAAAAVIQAGCPDPFGFVPKRVAANAPLAAGTPTEVDLFDLPGADVMIGDVTARVAYASVVVYDDRNGNGTLDLRIAARDEKVTADAGPFDPDAAAAPSGPDDVVYGASFVSMTRPDQRLTYREGAFNAAAAFYPRAGCAAPPPGFSILAAGGFSEAAALAAVLTGQLPQEDPASCAQGTLDQTVATVAIADPQAVAQLVCAQRVTNGTTRYREPPGSAPDLTNRAWACAGLPVLPGGTASGARQLVIAGPPDNACKSLTHYTLRGCNNDPACAHPDWDLTASPPSWWPCGP